MARAGSFGASAPRAPYASLASLAALASLVALALAVPVQGDAGFLDRLVPQRQGVGLVPAVEPPQVQVRGTDVVVHDVGVDLRRDERQAVQLLLVDVRRTGGGDDAARMGLVGNEGGDENTLYVSTVFVDGARTLKRMRPAPQGRGYRVRKRSNHVTLTVSDQPTAKEQKKTAAKKTYSSKENNNSKTLAS